MDTALGGIPENTEKYNSEQQPSVLRETNILTSALKRRP